MLLAVAVTVRLLRGGRGLLVLLRWWRRRLLVLLRGRWRGLLVLLLRRRRWGLLVLLRRRLVVLGRLLRMLPRHLLLHGHLLLHSKVLLLLHGQLLLLLLVDLRVDSRWQPVLAGHHSEDTQQEQQVHLHPLHETKYHIH